MDLLNPGPSQQSQRQLLTEQQIAQAEALSKALQDNALSEQPIYSPWAGVARMADALAGNIVQSRQANAQRDITGYTEQQLAKALGIPIPGQPSQALPSAPEAQSAPPTGQQQSYQVDPSEKAAIAANESGGSYTEIGPRVKGNWSHPAGYALGKYQVMNYDLPQKLAEAGLPQMSEGQFLSSPDVQEAQFNHEFGKLRSTHSFADAASMWHSGVPLDRAIKEGRSDGYMTTAAYVQKALKNLAPISTAQAAEAPKTATTGLTEEALRAAGQKIAPGFAGRFGNQPQNFDQAGNPLPQGGAPATFEQRFGGMLLPPKPDPGIPMPPPFRTPDGRPVPHAPAAPAAAPAMPHVAVTPRPAGTGQPIPGTLSLQQQHAILNLIGQPATHELGMSLAKQYLMPQQVTAPTGYTYMGTPGAGYTPSQMPGVPTELPSVTGPFGAHAPSFLPGSRTPQVTIPTVGGAGAEAVSAGAKALVDEASKWGKESREWVIEQLSKMRSQ